MKQRIYDAAQTGYQAYLFAVDDVEPDVFLGRLRDDLAWSDDDADQVELILRTMIANSRRGHLHDWT